MKRVRGVSSSPAARLVEYGAVGEQPKRPERV